MKKHRNTMNKTTGTTAVVDPDEPLFDTTFRSSYQDDPISNLREIPVQRMRSVSHVGSVLGDAAAIDVLRFSEREREPMPWDRVSRSRFATDEYNGFSSEEEDWN